MNEIELTFIVNRVVQLISVAIPLIVIIVLAVKFKKFAKDPFNENLLNQMSEKNPGTLIQSLSRLATDNPDVKKELASFKKIKEIKKVSEGAIDLTAIHQDGSEHLYRAQIDQMNKKILALSRYS